MAFSREKAIFLCKKLAFVRNYSDSYRPSFDEGVGDGYPAVYFCRADLGYLNLPLMFVHLLRYYHPMIHIAKFIGETIGVFI